MKPFKTSESAEGGEKEQVENRLLTDLWKGEGFPLLVRMPPVLSGRSTGVFSFFIHKGQTLFSKVRTQL